MNISPRERQLLDAISRASSITEAVYAVGGDIRTNRRRLATLKQKGFDIRPGMIPGQREGFEVHSASTLVKHTDGDGQVVLEWVKQSRTAEEIEAFAKRLEDRVEGRGPRIKAPVFKD